MQRDVVASQLDHVLFETRLEGFANRYQGKVRDTYRHGDRLILVTTDRISAFDHVLRQAVPFKGQVLNQLASYFFQETADLVPNHLVSVPDPNVTVADYCDQVPVEFVVRGYLAGHAWREYSAGKRILCGVAMPDGMRQNSRFPAPILTPATKAVEGHDEDISRDEIIRRGVLTESEFDHLASMAFALFERGSEMAGSRGLILVDTKYEFGRSPSGEFVVIDEIHTPDSSRYFYSDTFEDLLSRGEPQRQLSKEFLREWLMDSGFQGRDEQQMPDLPDAVRIDIALRYIELYETVSGRQFIPDTHPNPEQRILDNLAGA